MIHQKNQKNEDSQYSVAVFFLREERKGVCQKPQGLLHHWAPISYWLIPMSVQPRSGIPCCLNSKQLPFPASVSPWASPYSAATFTAKPLERAISCLSWPPYVSTSPPRSALIRHFRPLRRRLLSGRQGSSRLSHLAVTLLYDLGKRKVDR